MTDTERRSLVERLGFIVDLMANNDDLLVLAPEDAQTIADRVAAAARLLERDEEAPPLSNPVMRAVADAHREAEEKARRYRAALEDAAQVAEGHAERLQHTSHRDGLGMGWQDGEALCREIAGRIRGVLAPTAARPSPTEGEP